MGVFETIIKNWFLIGIASVILLARAAPWVGMKGGPMYPEITVKYIAVSVIFFNSGLTLRNEDLSAAIKHVKLHAFIQLFTFLAIPFVIQIIVAILISVTSINQWLLRGLLVVSCMPPPVSSAVIITKAIGGNEAGAIFNSAVGSFLGIFISPLLLLAVVGVSSEVPVGAIVKSLTATVVLPLLIGQGARWYVKEWLTKTKPPLSTIGSCMLLLIIYTTFCDTFNSSMDGIKISEMISMCAIILVLQLGFINFIFYLTTSFNLGYSPGDVVALMFCATHKSLTLGMPMLKIIYSGYKYLPLISIPLLIYHPTQILLGGVLVPFIKHWLLSVKKDLNNGSGVETVA